MRRSLVFLGLSGLLLAGAALAQGSLPYWAYPVPKPAPGSASKPDNTILKSLPGAKRRFTEAGLINEPGCQAAPEKDEFGLFLEPPKDPLAPKPHEEIYGRSSGVIGLRLFKNPNFNANAGARWDVQRYFQDANYFNDPELVRPYRVGMSCAFCHAAPHPLNPPADTAEPESRSTRARFMPRSTIASSATR